MKTSITYHEAQEFILKQFNLKPNLSMVDDRTMRVLYDPGFLLPNVSVDVHIEAIQGNMVLLTYKCDRRSVELIVEGAVALLGERISPKFMKIDTATRSVQVFVDEIDQMKELLKYVIVQDAYFEPDWINVNLLMK